MFPAWRRFVHGPRRPAVQTPDRHRAARSVPLPQRPRISAAGPNEGEPMTAPLPTDADAALFGNRFITQEVPSSRVPGRGYAGRGRDAAGVRGPGDRGRSGSQPGHLRDDLDGAGGAADHRREPAPQLHRPCGVPAHGRDRAALHPDDRGPVPRARRDHGGTHPGLVGGDHAGRVVAEVEVAGASAGRRPSRRRARTWSSAATCTWSGRSSAATSTSSRGSCRCSRASTPSAPTTWRRTWTRTPSAWRRCSAPPSPATRTTSSASTTCCCRSRASAGSTSRCTSTVPAAASSGRSSIRTPPGTSGSSRCAPSTSPDTSSGWSTPASAG